MATVMAPRKRRESAASRNGQLVKAPNGKPVSPHEREAIGLLAYGILCMALRVLNRKAQSELRGAFRRIDELFTTEELEKLASELHGRSLGMEKSRLPRKKR